jgi:phosphomannomutase/phosphoglucomutase
MYSIVACDSTIFRAYDIRGRVPEELNPDVVYTLARAYATLATAQGITNVTIARDGRISGPTLSDALAAGLMAGGIHHVYDIGPAPTPLLYFSCYHLNTGSGIMLTGSHNPKNYNGLKMMLGGVTLFGDQILKLRDIIKSGEFSTGHGTRTQKPIQSIYSEAVASRISLNRPLKIAIDCGNGITGMIAPELFKTLGCEVVSLYEKVDGSFPNHHPDPSKPENLSDLITAVRANNCDVGLAFDGDGDRLGVVTQAGEVIWPDRQMVLFAKDVLTRQPGSQIIFDVKCTQQLPLAIKELGGTPLMCRTGHSFVKKALKESNAPLAGEMSGHIFFNDNWYGFDDALFAGARLLEILSQADNINAVFEALPNSFNTPEINIAIPDAEKFIFMDKFAAQAVFDGGEVNTIDGVRVDFTDGFGLVRASNTTPNLVLRFEGTSPQSLERIRSMFLEQLSQCGVGQP